MPKLLIALAIVIVAFSTPANSQNKKSGDWVYSVTEDPITDEKMYSAETRSSNAELVIQCSNNKVALAIFGIRKIVDILEPLDIVYRIDKRAPVKTGGLHYGKFFVFSENDRWLAREIANANNRFAIQALNQTVVFSAKGSTKAITEMLKACDQR